VEVGKDKRVDNFCNIQICNVDPEDLNNIFTSTKLLFSNFTCIHIGVYFVAFSLGM
jgi:hypothetical protein